MGGWWSWTKWVVYYVVTIVLLAAIYIQVIQTRFECVIFSTLALIYFQQIGQYSGLLLESVSHRDHRNEVHRSLSERLSVPLAPEMTEAFDEFAVQTAKARTRYLINDGARLLLWLIVIWHLFKAAFFWS